MSPREKKLFFFCLIVGLAVLFDRIIINNTLKQIASLEVKIKDEENKIRQDLLVLNNRDIINKESQKFAQYVPELMQGKQEINTELSSKFERLAAQANVSLVIKNLGETQEEDTHIKYYANLDCSGELKDMVSFMHLVNSTQDLFKIVEFSMSPKRGADDQVSTSLKVVKLIPKPKS